MKILDRIQQLGSPLVPPAGSSWLVDLVCALVNLDESDAENADRKIGAIIWPQYAPHTISWNLGRLIVEDKNPQALAICALLADFLGTGHCVNAYEHGS